VHLVSALHFPPIGELLEWKDLLLKDTPFAVNKVVLIMWAAAILSFLVFFLAGRKQSLVPTGVQNAAESIVDFIREGIIYQTMGPEGLGWTPFLTSLFLFIFFCNIVEIIPLIQFPANARMAAPLFLALLVWVLFNVVGIRSQGLGGYLKNSLFPPGVPKALYILVTPIEFISTFIVRPFSLAVRLFANMLAGHLLLVTFAILAAATWSLSPLIVVSVAGAFPMLVFLTGFEILVSVLQAYIFTILAAVYIGGAMHPEH
jgi:F-type H+-transporting ATPase subunit a